MTPAVPEPELEAGAELHGFAVRRVTPLPGLHAVAYEAEHTRTGARLLHLATHDTEKLFSLTFRTLPSDDTGLLHILEHAVLGGSRKYPVKDPFIEMLKMSMATFMNAITGEDRTMYPVATTVRQDFFNLASVYCDAVFRPALRLGTFQQEGHHLDFVEKGDLASALQIKGIVFSEMKGAYSDAEDRVQRYSLLGLFPDTPYGRDAGGDPEHIPELTYRQFLRAHRTLYRPGNACIFTYGDIPLAEILAFLEGELKGSARRPAVALPPRQPRWDRPREIHEKYAIAPSEDPKGKTFLTLNWLIGEGADPQEVLAFRTLNLYLLGYQGAPLRKALIDSKLGEDLTSSGFWDGSLESTFHVGLRGSEAGRQDAFIRLVLETLAQVARTGLPRENFESALRQLQYRYFEICTGHPLGLMERACNAWLYGADPLTYLRIEEHLAAFRERYNSDADLFPRLVREKLLDNPHRLAVVCEPDPGLQARQDAALAARLGRLKSSLKIAQLRKIAQQAAELERAQGTPNPPAALAALPQLRVRDLPRRPRHIPTTIERHGGVELLCNDVFANGLVYFHLDVDLAGLPPELYPFLPLYGDCVQKMGAAGQDFVTISERLSKCTGGLEFGAFCRTHASEVPRCMKRARFTLKTLDGQAAEALALLHDLIFALDVRAVPRLRDVLVQAKAEQRGDLVAYGAEIALRGAGRTVGPEAYLEDLLDGAPQTRLIEDLADGFAARQEEVCARLEAIRVFMLNRTRWTASFTGSEPACEEVRKALRSWSGEARAEPVQDAAVALPVAGRPPRAGLTAPMEVAFCALVLPAPHGSHPDAPLLSVASRLLSLGYMWDEVRVKGGAYGGGCGYNGGERSWYFYSARDPRVAPTLALFQGLLRHVQEAQWSEVEIGRAVIGSVKDGERPIRPGEATGLALSRHVLGETRELREGYYADMLHATSAELKRAVLHVLEAGLPQAGVCVVSSREKLEAANRELGAAPLALEPLMRT